jgi:hypothetical protein
MENAGTRFACAVHTRQRTPTKTTPRAIGYLVVRFVNMMISPQGSVDTSDSSVCKDVGKYGSDVAENSIWNDVGPYGRMCPRLARGIMFLNTRLLSWIVTENRTVISVQAMFITIAHVSIGSLQFLTTTIGRTT